MKEEDLYDELFEKIIEIHHQHIRRKAEHLVLLSLCDSEKLIWGKHIRGLGMKDIEGKSGKYIQNINRTIRRIEEKIDICKKNLFKTNTLLSVCYDIIKYIEGDTV